MVRILRFFLPALLVASCATADSGSGSKSAAPSAPAFQASTCVGRVALEVEASIKPSAFAEAWYGHRAEWRRLTARATNTVTLTGSLLDLYGHLESSAFSEGWRTRQVGWMDDCLAVANEAELAMLFAELVDNISSSAVGGSRIGGSDWFKELADCSLAADEGPALSEAGASGTEPGSGGTLGYKVSGGGTVELPGPVLFEPGTDRLLLESGPVLDYVKSYLEAVPEVTLLRIEGHTDMSGGAATNLDLSKRRAMSVSKGLTARGVDCKRLRPVGVGQTRPIVDPEVDAMDAATNRRVAFVNAHINGKPIVGAAADGGGKFAGDPCR